MRKIIIDCDIGNGIAGANVDDGLALALALVSPEIEVKAVTTVSGNVLNYKACLVAKRFLPECTEIHCVNRDSIDLCMKLLSALSAI